MSEVPLYAAASSLQIQYMYMPRTRRLTPNSYRGTSLIRNSTQPGPYSRTMPRALWWPWWRGEVLMSEVPL